MLKTAGLVLGSLLAFVTLAAAASANVLSTALGGNASKPSASALADIPPNYLALYRKAADTCPGLDWSVLAAIGKIETNHGRSDLPGVHSGANYAGARGPMQFLTATFHSVIAKHPPPSGGSTPASPYNPHDAIYAAASYLCDSGARGGHHLYRAIFSYNHADWYVAKVLAQARTYRSTAPGTGTAPRPTARRALSYAEGQLGLPYTWGGNGPAAGDPGFDCSGLSKAAYAAAGIRLPRTAQEQWHTGPRLPRGTALQPGELVFYGNTSSGSGGIHHVGIYVGDGQMIDAPSRGKPIRIEPYRWRGDDYAGATRPTSPQR